jgi:hypothetical protein
VGLRDKERTSAKAQRQHLDGLAAPRQNARTDPVIQASDVDQSRETSGRIVLTNVDCISFD